MRHAAMLNDAACRIAGMIEGHKFLIFLGAATLLAAAPGPGMLYVLARTLAGGRREGILSSLGTFLGGLVHVVAAATGLSLVLATSAKAFMMVKYVGAAYLVYLGIRMLVTARQDPAIDLPAARVRSPFWQGIVTEALNPKTALFFLAFIPQFVSHERGGVIWQFLLLGTISVVLNTSFDLMVTLLASPIGARLRSSARLRRRQRTATGLTLIGLGTYLAVAEQH
jgi:threonine/homoserine/homoserine lactone efflux protein